MVKKPEVIWAFTAMGGDSRYIAGVDMSDDPHFTRYAQAPKGSVVLTAEEAKALLTRESYIHNTMPVYGNVPVTNEKVVCALLARLTSEPGTDP